MNRRVFLQAGSLSCLGFGLADMLQLRQTAQASGAPGRAKACILLFLTGGPAQHETFDPKPDGPDIIRGEFQPIATSVPGIQVSEHLPMLARNAHRYTLLRSVWHRSDTHGVGTHYNMTGLDHAPGRPAGEPQPDRRDPPCFGSAVRQLRGDRNGLPGAMQFPRPVGDQNTYMWAGQHAGYLGPRYDPLSFFDENWLPGDPIPGFAPPSDVDARRQAGRRELLETVQARRPSEGAAEVNYRRYQEQAFDVLRSGPAWRAFRIDLEPPHVVERYGNNRFGRSCLVARRLVEAGVGVVTVPG